MRAFKNILRTNKGLCASLNNEPISKILSNNRTMLMGVAMIFVLIYHAFCWVYNPIGSLNIGYVGVDVFLFLSGFGLRYSYEKNSLLQFYNNRIKRVFPIYSIAVLIAYLILHSQWDLRDFFLNILTLGYYINHGANRFDWYVESLFSLYLLFPLFYYFSKLKIIGICLLFTIIALLLHYFKIEWWYDCLISRLPIFVLGIAFHKLSNKKILTIAIVGVIFYIPCSLYSSKFLAASLLVFPIIMIAISISRNINEMIKSVIDYFGKYSLELYLSNVLVMYVIQTNQYSTATKAMMFIILQVLLSCVTIKISKAVQNVSIINT